MADEPVDDIAAVIRDGIHVAIGLGVLAAQRIQQQRGEIEALLGRSTDAARQSRADALRAVEAQLAHARDQLDAALDEIDGHLSPTAADAVAGVRRDLDEARGRLRSLADPR